MPADELPELPEGVDLAAAITRTAHLVPPSPAEVEVVVGPVEVEHELQLVSVEGHTVGVRCRCGRWDAIVTGPTSARWAAADHRRHVEHGTGR